MAFNFGEKTDAPTPETKPATPQEKLPVPDCPDCHVPMDRYGKTNTYVCPKCGRRV